MREDARDGRPGRHSAHLLTAFLPTVSRVNELPPSLPRPALRLADPATNSLGDPSALYYPGPSHSAGDTPLKEQVRMARLRWRVDRDYQEMKGEVGLEHFEGRSCRGLHHHATLCMVAHGFLALRRARFPRGRHGGHCLRCGGSSNSCGCAASATVHSACARSTLARLLGGPSRM